VYILYIYIRVDIRDDFEPSERTKAVDQDPVRRIVVMD